jgi:hypothetical protein
MTAATATDEKRVALAMVALALGTIAMGGVLVMFGIFVARPRAGQLEVGP